MLLRIPDVGLFLVDMVGSRQRNVLKRPALRMWRREARLTLSFMFFNHRWNSASVKSLFDTNSRRYVRLSWPCFSRSPLLVRVFSTSYTFGVSRTSMICAI